MLEPTTLLYARQAAERLMTSTVRFDGAAALTRDEWGNYAETGVDPNTTKGNLVAASTTEASGNQRTQGKTTFHLFTPWNSAAIPRSGAVEVDGKFYQVVGEVGPPSDDVIQRDTLVFLD